MDTSILEKKYNHLKQKKDFSGRGRCVTANIRKHLKYLYPDIKFSVKNTYSIDISWIDGPTHDDVKSALSIFNDTDFTDIFDGDDYIFYHNTLSDERVKIILDRINKNRDDSLRISFEDYNNSSEVHFKNDFKNTLQAYVGGHLTELECNKYITLENFDRGIIHEALINNVPTFYLDTYVYLVQPQLLKNNIKNIEFQKKKIIDITEEYRCKNAGIETPDERESRLYNEKQYVLKILLDNIEPIKIEFLNNHKDINVMFPALNKNNDLQENMEELKKDSHTSIYELYKIVTLSDEDYVLASNNLMQEIKSIWTNEYPEDYYIDPVYNIAHFPVIEVINDKTKERFIVDTQGYKYARYVGQEVNC